VALWYSGSLLDSINVVAVHRAWLVLGWVTTGTSRVHITLVFTLWILNEHRLSDCPNSNQSSNLKIKNR